jgi:hypothetical protein
MFSQVKALIVHDALYYLGSVFQFNMTEPVTIHLRGATIDSRPLRGVKRRSNLSFGGARDCFASLAMTVLRRP